jgi:hypothetical protein
MSLSVTLTLCLIALAGRSHCACGTSIILWYDVGVPHASFRCAVTRSLVSLVLLHHDACIPDI